MTETLRFLTSSEIKEILSFIKPNPYIPREIAVHQARKHIADLTAQLEQVEVYPSIISSLKKEIEKHYYDTIISPGESVGILCAQSIGERQTQSNLNTFHKAGSSDKQPTTSKFSEILNATKDPKAPSCLIYFKHGNEDISTLRKTIGKSIVSITLSSLISDYKICTDKESEFWYEAFKIMHDISDDLSLTDCISFYINMELLYTYKLTLENIYDHMCKEYSDMICIYAPDNYARLDIFVNCSHIYTDEKVAYVTSENAKEVYLEDVVLPKLKEINLTGIMGIKNMFFIRDEKNWAIETENSKEKLPASISRYKKILSHPDVDSTRTMSNNIWDIYNTLGIEAVRQYMIEEFSSVMDGINLCHVMLLVDKMTFSGTVSSISRYTMRAEESGPLGKASFEETLDNFIAAGSYGQEDNTKGVSASVICGKRGGFGTGICDVVMDMSVYDIEEEE